MVRSRFLLVDLLALAVPVTASAQPATFIQAVRALADAARQPGADRGAGIRNAAAGIGAAVAEWDRAIEAQESRTDRELTEAPSHRFQLHVDLGIAYQTRGRLKDAIHEFDAALEAARTGPALRASDVQLLRALAFESDGRRTDADEEFRAAWSADPANPEKAYYLLQRTTNTPADGIERAGNALSQVYDRLRSTATRPGTIPFVVTDALPDTALAGPVVGNASTGPAFALLASGNYSEALAQLSAVTPDGGRTLDGPLLRFAQAQEDEKENRIGEARQGDGAAPARARGGRTLDGPLLRFAQAQEDEKENRIGEARQGYVAALAGTLAGRSAIYVAIGRLSRVEGDLPGAVDAFAHAVRLNPADQTVRQELASAWAASGRVDDSFAELVAGLLVNPANATLHAAIGQLRLDADHPADAIPAFVRALELNPAGYEVRYALASALTHVGKLDEAATQLAMFESARREMLERRRHDIQQDVDREEAIRRGLTRPGGTP